MLNSFGGAAFDGFDLTAVAAAVPETFEEMLGTGVGLRADGSTEPIMSAAVGRPIAIEFFPDLLGVFGFLTFALMVVSSSS
jgi:hypothetical protein